MTSDPHPLPACMGGHCSIREHCSRYHAADRRFPVERLCWPGQDGVSDMAPAVLRRPVGTWESARPLQPIPEEQAWL